MNDGDQSSSRRDRQRVRHLSVGVTLTGYGGADPGDSGLRRRPLPCVSAGPARPRGAASDFWAWRDGMIALAELAERRRRSDASTSRSTASCGRTATRRSASSTTSGSRRRGRRPKRRPRRASRFVCLYACYLRGGIPRFRQESVADYLTQLEALRARRHPRRRRPPLRPRVPGRRAARARRATRPSTSCRCTCTPTSSRGRSRSASPSTACGRSSCSRAKAASARGRRSCTRRTPTAPSSTCCRDAGARICVCPTTEANLGDGFLPVARVVPPRDPACASAPTRTCASTRSRSCASSKGSRGARPASAASSPLDALLAFGSDEGAAALGLDAWPDAVVDLDASAASRRRRRTASTTPWSSAAAATCCGRRPTSSASASRYAFSAADAVQSPRAVVATGSGSAPCRRGRRGRLDLRSLVPLVERRDRHAVGARSRSRRATSRRRSRRCGAASRAGRRCRGARRSPARPTARRARCIAMRLGAEPLEHVAAVRDDVVGVDAVEAGRGRRADERRSARRATEPPACSARLAAAQSATGRSNGR